MPVTIHLCEIPPDRRSMDALLGEYYALMTRRIVDMGGVLPADDRPALQQFWSEIDSFLPPRGRLYIAQDADDGFVGCGSLKKISATKGELKRLYVQPRMRGTGLGRKLVELRLRDARDMGLREIYVDTLKVSVEMLGLYRSLGFEEIAAYQESSTFQILPELEPYMTFLRIDL